jgi:hypothetical protein
MPRYPGWRSMEFKLIGLLLPVTTLQRVEEARGELDRDEWIECAIEAYLARAEMVRRYLPQGRSRSAFAQSRRRGVIRTED